MPIYDPKSVTFIVAGVVISGFDEDEFINAERNTDLYKQKVGRDGVIEVRSTDRTGKITVKLLSSSFSNDFFSGLLALDEASPYGTMSVPLLIKDANGATAAAGVGRIKGWPKLGYGSNPTGREWVFNVQNLKIFIGGHN
jgi:hypothetical protein